MKKLLLLLVFSASLFASAQTHEYFVLGPDDMNSPERVVLGGATVSVGTNTFNVVGDDLRITTAQSPTQLTSDRTFQLFPEHLTLGQTLVVNRQTTGHFSVDVSRLTSGEDIDINYFRNSEGMDVVGQIDIAELPDQFMIPRSLPAGIYTVGLYVDGEVIPTQISINHGRFEYPCGQSMIVGSPGNVDCGGSKYVPFVNFEISQAGEYTFLWADDGENEYQTPIYVGYDGSVAVGASVERGVSITPSVTVATPQGLSSVAKIATDTLENTAYEGAYGTIHELFDGLPFQSRFETGTSRFTISVRNGVFGGAGNEWEILLASVGHDQVGRRFQVSIPSYGISMVGVLNSASDGPSYDTIIVDIPAEYTDNAEILSFLQRIEPAMTLPVEQPRIILRME